MFEGIRVPERLLEQEEDGPVLLALVHLRLHVVLSLSGLAGPSLLYILC